MQLVLYTYSYLPYLYTDFTKYSKLKAAKFFISNNESDVSFFKTFFQKQLMQAGKLVLDLSLVPENQSLFWIHFATGIRFQMIQMMKEEKVR